MNKQDKIYVAGHNGMVGSAIVRRLRAEGFSNLLLAGSGELDLRNQQDVLNFFKKNKPDYVFLAAAKVGGIQANNIYRAEFLYDNLAIELNVIDSAYKCGVTKLLFLGSSCIYPKASPQPMKEEYLLSGYLEQTNEPYAIAKIAGIKLCEAYRDQYGCNFISAMPTNLYGPNDNYHLEHSHVLPALIRKFHDAKVNGDATVEVWGSGTPKREFLHVDDLANACVFLMKNYNEKQFLNIGFGEDISIAELAQMIMDITGFKGSIVLNTSKPDGTFRKLLDSTRIHQLGWKAEIGLHDGIRNTYQDFLHALEQQVLASR
ncbi:MAG: GDP-L-fucose synthase [Bacteroidetes bacterium]|nr:GDP-L-fucose synthase [Bacteroidota bacterium]MBL0139380.1 GDP-L-fucose synthase [Bacteroidota bacterium]